MVDSDIRAEKRRERNKKIAKLVSIFVILALIIFGLIFGVGMCNPSSGQDGQTEDGNTDNSDQGTGQTDADDPGGSDDEISVDGNTDNTPPPDEADKYVVTFGVSERSPAMTGAASMAILGTNFNATLKENVGQIAPDWAREAAGALMESIEDYKDANPSWNTAGAIRIEIPTYNEQPVVPQQLQDELTAEIQRLIDATDNRYSLTIRVVPKRY